MPSFIKTNILQEIGTISLDNYQKRNALSSGLVNALIAALDQLVADNVKVIILKAEGNNAVWSSGHDINELPSATQDPLPYNDPLEILLRKLRSIPVPIIAMIQGSVWGGACDVVMNCDVVLADETCSFAITPTKLGLPYNASGILHFLHRIPVNLLKEIVFTAEPLDAKRALQYHLINDLVPQEQLEERVYDMAKTICLRSRESIAVFKMQVRLILESCAINPETFEYIEQLRRNVYVGADYAEGIKAFIEKRQPKFL